MAFILNPDGSTSPKSDTAQPTDGQGDGAAGPAGMVGGAIGVGVAYPLDTVKVKTQAFAETAAPGEKLPSVWALARWVLDEEGLAACYSGVSSTMLGQALIKGVVFWSYEATKTLVVDLLSAGGSVGVDAAALSAGWLFFAACVSGAEKAQC